MSVFLHYIVVNFIREISSLIYSYSRREGFPLNKFQRWCGSYHTTPAASEGVIDTRGIVPRLCHDIFFLCTRQVSTSSLTSSPRYTPNRLK